MQKTHILSVCAFVALVLPAATLAADAPYEQSFVITAYYSPLPGQCCYVKGGLLADRVLNGDGIRGADGTDVYSGMAAAPPTYAFGTRIELPGLGNVTVHDRGGAIQEWDNAHRLDLWVGSGEEGLARALAFGVREVRGTVYPVGSQQPAENFVLESLPAPAERLTPFAVQSGELIGLAVNEGDSNYSVRLLQQALNTVGYFPRSVTGFFGPETKTSLEKFVADYRIGESAQSLSDRTAAFLKSAIARIGARSPIEKELDVGSQGARVASAQRLLRFLGYYRGRTNGVYDDRLAAAVLKFQLEKGIVASQSDAGAGRIGPTTKGLLTAEWNRKLVASRAERELALARVTSVLAQRGHVLDRFLSEGDSGDQVSRLQRLLAKNGYFPEHDVNGHYGPLTKSAVLQYQIDRGIIVADGDIGSGNVGPLTLARLQHEQQMDAYRLVRASGWSVL